MIVVIGHPLAVAGGDRWRPTGTSALAALEAVRAGATVQLVGKAGDDPTGDAIVLALGAAGVGHVALLRDPSRPTPVVSFEGPTDDADSASDAARVRIEPDDPDRRPTLEAADVELGLRYLTDFAAVVVAEPLPDLAIQVAVDAARYAGAQLVVVAGEGRSFDGLPEGALVMTAQIGGIDAGFASLLGQVAAAMDRGEPPDAALRLAVARVGASASG